MFFTKRHYRANRTCGEVVDLQLNRVYTPQSYPGAINDICFDIYLHHSDVRIGRCDLRPDMNEENYYAGNIGYRIYTPYRGNGYAYEAAELLLKLAWEEYGMDELIITCSPENTPSRCTIEKLGGRFKEEAEVPVTHWLYERGELVKYIYVFKKDVNKT